MGSKPTLIRVVYIVIIIIAIWLLWEGHCRRKANSAILGFFLLFTALFLMHWPLSFVKG